MRRERRGSSRRTPAWARPFRGRGRFRGLAEQASQRERPSSETDLGRTRSTSPRDRIKSRQGRPTIAHRFIGGSTGTDDAKRRVPSGTKERAARTTRQFTKGPCALRYGLGGTGASAWARPLRGRGRFRGLAEQTSQRERPSSETDLWLGEPGATLSRDRPRSPHFRSRGTGTPALCATGWGDSGTATIQRQRRRGSPSIRSASVERNRRSGTGGARALRADHQRCRGPSCTCISRRNSTIPSVGSLARPS